MRRLSQLLIVCVLFTMIFQAVSNNVTSASSGRNKNSKFLKVARAIPNRYIVVLNEEMIESNASVAAQRVAPNIEAVAVELTARYGGNIGHIYDAALTGFAVEMSEPEAIALSNDARVKFVEEDGEVHTTTIQFNPPAGLDRIDQQSVPLNNAYSYTSTGRGVNVYVIDTGIRPTHSDFGGRAAAVFDAFNGNGLDCEGHGTHVAATVGGSRFGVAKEVNLFGVRVLGCNGSGSKASVIAGIDWVTRNHRKPAVANMSLGGGISRAEDLAVKRSIKAGVTYVVAAGNESQDARNFSPAGVSEAITVAASDSTDRRASFSNFGSVVDLFAPGVNIDSAGISSDTAIERLSGTSMSSPHVAGAAALFLQNNPTATPSQVEQALKKSALSGKISDAAGAPNLLLYLAAADNFSGNEIVINGGFEAGLEPWQIEDDAGDVFTGFPHSGQSYAVLGIENDIAGILYQNVTIPANAATASLSFWANISTEETDEEEYDTLVVAVYDYDRQEYVEALELLSNLDADDDYRQFSGYDLSAYGGRNIALVFIVETDESNATRFRIDDVSISAGKN